MLPKSAISLEFLNMYIIEYLASKKECPVHYVTAAVSHDGSRISMSTIFSPGEPLIGRATLFLLSPVEKRRSITYGVADEFGCNAHS